MHSKISRTIIDTLLIIIGTFIMSLSINFFLLPNRITTGGASGIATILYYKFDFNMGLSILIINIPLFIMSIKKLGFKFSFKSIFTTLLLTTFIDLFTYNSYILHNRTDMVISSIYGGLLLGIGISLVFKAGASSGGTDLLAHILQKKAGTLNLSKIILISDMVIIIALMIVFNDINLGLYSAIAIYISSKMIDIVFEGINYTKVINIITKNDSEITNKIIDVMKRGATITKCMGAYSKEDYINITCIATLPEISKIKKIVYDIDSNAFIYISNTNEVWGNGFKIF
ncbi:MAG: YitT family protein [Clostridia bacterium]|nr:YitT family protein [Clostridia bacterium]MDD4387203.1 YitT family protein [Clostridia bacterium]